MTHRRDDPETSLEAADAIAPVVRLIQRRVLALLRERPDTQSGLIARYRDRFGAAAESTVRTRCAELVEAGWVQDSTQRATTPSGRRAVIWEPTSR